MHLIKNDLITIANQVTTTFCELYGIDPQRQQLFDVEHWQRTRGHDEQFMGDYSHTLDFFSTAWIAEQAETFIFDSDHVREFIRSVDRQLPPGEYEFPFDAMVFQFSQPIPERLFTSGITSLGNQYEPDEIMGLLLIVPNTETGQYMNVIAWYKSTALNRVQLHVAGDGTIEYRQMFVQRPEHAEQMRQDKQRIVNLAMLLVAYINSPVVEVEHVQPSERVNRKRAAKGKTQLPEYRVVRIAKERRVGTSGGSGGAAGVQRRLHSVRGHLRVLPSGTVTWVRAHVRGTDTGDSRERVYRVSRPRE